MREKDAADMEDHACRANEVVVASQLAVIGKKKNEATLTAS